MKSAKPISSKKKTNLAFFVIDHHVMWLHIPVHDAFAMAKVKSLEELVNIVADIIVNEARIERSEVGIIDVLENKTRGFALIVAHDIKKRDNIRSPR